MISMMAPEPRPVYPHEAIPKGKSCSLVPCVPDPGLCGMSELCQAKTYFDPHRVCGFSRVSECEWDKYNQASYCISGSERVLSQRFRNDAWRSVAAAAKTTRMRQLDTTTKLGEKSRNASFWKDELLKEINANTTETQALQNQCQLLENALYNAKSLLHISEENVLHREKRTGIDQCHDEVEKALCREILIIKRCMKRMEKMIERATIQIKKNRCEQHTLDIDFRDKHHAQGLDNMCQGLRNDSFGIGNHPGVECYDNNISNTTSWVAYTQANIRSSQKARKVSELLRYDVDLCLRQCANTMWTQFEYVNHSLDRRINEESVVRNKLEEHLKKTRVEIDDMQRAIASIKQGIVEKDIALMVAMTRLDERTRRICMELCRDKPDKGLRTEIDELHQSRQNLRERLRKAEVQLCRLMNVRAHLERDIAVKDDSIQIDSGCCLSQRKCMPLDPKIGPLYRMDNCVKAGSINHNTWCGLTGYAMTGSAVPPSMVSLTGASCCT